MANKGARLRHVSYRACSTERLDVELNFLRATWLLSGNQPVSGELSITMRSDRWIDPMVMEKIRMQRTLALDMFNF